MLHHLSFAVSNLERSASFYDAVLGVLGYSRVWTYDNAIGYGQAGSGDKFAIKIRGKIVVPPSEGFHVAFAAQNRDAVNKFHTAALVHGGTDNGAPGLRPHYGKNYYAAFVKDPDGYLIEAVVNEAA